MGKQAIFYSFMRQYLENSIRDMYRLIGSCNRCCICAFYWCQDQWSWM